MNKCKRLNKLPLLAALPAAIFAANVSANDVTVYGKINVSLQAIEYDRVLPSDEKDNWELLSNASRLGVKGSVDLGDSNLQAIYKLEYETAVDDGSFGSGTDTSCVDGSGATAADGTIQSDECSVTSSTGVSQTFKQRNIYAGLKGGFGSVIAGKFDTPTKVAQGKVDQFGDLLIGDIKNVIKGENRMSNIVQYSTPEMSGFGANIAFMPGEDSGAAGDDENDGIADHISASVTYDSDMFYAAIAVDDDVNERDTVRLVGQVKVSNMNFGAIVQQSESSDTTLYGESDQDGLILSAKFKVGSGAIKAQYGWSETDVGTSDDVEITNYVLGYDHYLSKAAKVFAYYSNLETDNVAGAMGVDAESETLGMGVEVKF